MYGCFAAQYAYQHRAISHKLALWHIHAPLVAFYLPASYNGSFGFKRLIAFAGANPYRAKYCPLMAAYCYGAAKSIVVYACIRHIAAGKGGKTAYS